MRSILRASLFGFFLFIGISCESYFAPDDREQSPLRVVSVYPAMNATDIPIDAPMRIRFNKHLDAGYFSTSAIDLRSGNSSKWTMSYYDPLRMELVIWTSSSMLPNTVWGLRLDEDVRALDGSWLRAQQLTLFRTGSEKQYVPVYAQKTYFSDVKPIFDTHCVSCHSNGAFANLDLASVPDLVRTAINVPSAHWPDMVQIAPDRPGNSYLVYKLVDNPYISGRVMPRALDDGEPATTLSPKEKRTIMDWILSGALF
ncbi:MAG: Ig-like domain-containing protein [Deltaproteobacteria bacterium]|nr:Ig-like domain-containing protein [Deltaproteobacteria bacterium]